MTPLLLPRPLVGLAVFFAGVVLGRFLLLCIEQLPRKFGVVEAWQLLWERRPRHFADKIPLVSGLLLLARGERDLLKLRPLLLELLNGALLAALYYAVVPGIGGTVRDSAVVTPLTALAVRHELAPQAPLLLNLQFVYLAVLVEALVVATFIDFDLMVIPDSVTFPAAFVGLAGAAVGSFYLAPFWFRDPSLDAIFRDLVPLQFSGWFSGPARFAWIDRYPSLHGLVVSVLGLLVGGGVVWAIRIVGHRVLDREAMGFGDVILMAMIGTFLGWQATLLVFFIAPVCALVVALASWLCGRTGELPYGPYLSLAAYVLVVFWQPLWAVFERFFSLGLLLPVLGAVMLVLFAVLLMVVKVVFQRLGLSSDWVEDEWTSADQLQFFASRDPRAGQGELARREWPGALSGQGAWHKQQWNRGR